jgi:hypothetical protein
MFRHLLHRLHEPRERRIAFASHRRNAQWTVLVVLSLVVLFVGLDNMSLNVVLPLPDQLGAEGSALRWIDRAEAIATWTWTATVEIGLVAGDLVTLTPLSVPSFSSTFPAASA